MASEETENSSENNPTITFSSNTSHKSLSTEVLAPNDPLSLHACDTCGVNTHAWG